MLTITNSFFGHILRTPIAYHAGEIGTWRDGTWVGHKTFSGAEKALCYAAIQAALASLSPFRLMLVDEMNRVHDEYLGKLIDGVDAAVKQKRIDQFVGIDTGSFGRLEKFKDHALFTSSRLTVEIVGK